MQDLRCMDLSKVKARLTAHPRDEGYIQVRCPHIDKNGYICGRLLLKVAPEGETDITIKCPKCKNVISISKTK